MKTHRAFLRLILLVSTVVVSVGLGCSSGDQPLEVVDPGAAPADPDYELVFNIVHNECAPCHGGEDDGGDDAGPRPSLGASVEPPLETCDDIFNGREDIWQEIERNTMPPGAWPRLSEVEKLIVKRWLENGAKVPCR